MFYREIRKRVSILLGNSINEFHIAKDFYLLDEKGTHVIESNLVYILWFFENIGPKPSIYWLFDAFVRL